MINELSVLNETVIRDAKEYAGKKLAAKKHALAEAAAKGNAAERESLEKEINKNAAKICDEAKKQVAYLEKEAFKKLVFHREKINDDIKSELKKKLCGFVGTSEYKAFVAEKAENAKKLSDGSGIKARVFREEDVSLLDGIETEVAKADVAGGVIFEIESQGIIIDNSFDTAISTVMEGFNEIRLY